MTAAAWILIALTLVGVAIGRLPVLRMNRATLAIVGATGVVALGALPLGEALAAVDLGTLALLFGMMVLNANLRIAGFFGRFAGPLEALAHSPRQLLAATVAATGALSAVFLNDTVVLVMTPLVLAVTRGAGLAPIPFLVAVATAANAGSTATLVGNPQNMLIGVASGIGFARFLRYQAPVAAGALALVWAVIAVVYRRDLVPRPLAVAAPAAPAWVYQPLLAKGIAATAGLLVGLLAGAPPPLAALAAASLLLITRRLKPERVFREIDFSLLVFFAGLFAVTAAAERLADEAGLLAPLAERAAAGGVAGLAAVAAALSNLVSNVPAVLLLRPLVGGLADPERGWLTLATATTLAGNLTLLGSVANLLVAETARRERVTLGFGEYLKAGIPITLLSLAWGIAWLALAPG